MKNLKSILTHKKIDFTAIQIFISIIAILFASMVNGNSMNTTEFDSDQSVVQNSTNDQNICPVTSDQNRM